VTLNPTARATARRNVADRFDRFLNGLQHARHQPNRRELFWLRQALVSLDSADYPTGEDAMDKAERALPIPEHAANDLSSNADVTLEQLQPYRVLAARLHNFSASATGRTTKRELPSSPLMI
jgi:hypothetical protein